VTEREDSAISEVPNLQTGDRLWIHPAFPDNETVHYMLAVAFLQGAQILLLTSGYKS